MVYILDEGASWEDYMRNDLKALLDCTHLALLPGWEKSKGAHLELHIAHRLAMGVFQYDKLLKIAGEN